MPGIITHSRLFHESLSSLQRTKDPTPYNRSTQALFAPPERRRAGLFGALGPDIFDYLPVRRRDFFGTGLTMRLHSPSMADSLSSLLSRTLLVGDFNNEWSATRRAYCYGYVSHLIGDAVFHPFVYYWAGFPDGGSRRDIFHYREQLLLFQYNMDLFFQYHYNNHVFEFSLDDSLPVEHTPWGFRVLDGRIKSLLLEVLADSCPAELPRLARKTPPQRQENDRWGRGLVDLLPHLIGISYRIKRTGNATIRRIMDRIRVRRRLFPDYVTRYPEPRRMNRHALNLHRERWFHPTGAAGLHYESVEDLFKIARERTVAAWERMESGLYTGKADINAIISEFMADSHTGEAGAGPSSLRIKKPLRMRL
ncbi:MAG TPA: zinc dependent phospholipase C family protein [Spirochaetota bacterium]|nr:zinc dependent phospholipase C family protein [Spirochaetota bacterium]OPZ39114.1 MAG: hypothetical protein BWY96_00536 [Spirochaetes bacterium ADurb.BinA120]HPO44219.1 zinc dependent phospholipase C family protein [Spirochaetota bacterium]